MGKSSERAKQIAARKHRANGYAIGQEEHRALWKAYAQGKSMLQISKEQGLSYGVVRKYVERGDKRRGWEPLTERLARVRKQSLEIADRATLNTRVKIYKQAHTQLSNAVAISILATNRLDAYRREHTHPGPGGAPLFEAPGHREKRGPDGGLIGPADPGWQDSVFQRLLNAQRTAAQNVETWQAIVAQLTSWGAQEDDQEFRGWSTEELERFAETGELPDHVLGGEQDVPAGWQPSAPEGADVAEEEAE